SGHQQSWFGKQPSRRRFLEIGAIGLAGSAPRTACAEPEKQPVAPRKKIIAWGGIDWYSPETVQLNVRKIEELPFDGTVLQGFKANKGGKEVVFDWLCFGKERFERRQLARAIETLKNIKFRRFTDNLLRFN